MSELDDALMLANRVLDKPYIDPDGDICMLARQLLRQTERLSQSAPQQELVTAMGHDDALKQIDECMKRIEILCDGMGYDPSEFLADAGLERSYASSPAQPDVVRAAPPEDRAETAKQWLSHAKVPPGPEGVFIPHWILRNMS